MPAKFRGESELKSPTVEIKKYQKEKAHFNINTFKDDSNKGKTPRKKIQKLQGDMK